MNFVRKFALVLITPIFSLLLFATAFDMGVLRVAGHPNNVKQILSDSGIYKTAVNSVLDQAKQVTDSSSGAAVSLSNPTVRSAANATITPQYVQQQTESVIDSVYAWLNGKTAQPDFSIDVANLKGKFASQVAAAVQQQAATLPRCTDAASASAALNDPISATCLPAGVTPAAAASEAEGDLLNGQGFLDNTAINASSLKSKDSNQPVFSSGKLKDAPKQYQRLKKTPIILSVLALLTAVAIVFLNTSRRKGLRHVGVILLVIGLFMLLFAWGLGEAITKEVPKIKLNDAVLQTDVQKVVTDVARQINHNYWIFGGLYSVLGILALGAAMLWPGKGQGGKDDLEGEGKSEDDRIDLKAPDKATDLGGDKPQAKPAAPAKTAKPTAAKKTINVN